MKHRTVNKVRTNKAKKALKPKRLMINLRNKDIDKEALTWKSNIYGTYVKRVHGELK